MTKQTQPDGGQQQQIMEAPDRPQVATKPALRVGLLVDSTQGSYYAHDFIKWAAGNAHVAVTHLIVHAAPEASPRRRPLARLENFVGALRKDGLYAALSKFLFKCLVTFERRLLTRDSRYTTRLRSYDLSSQVKDVVEIKPIVSKSGFVFRFKPDDVEKVKALDLDILLRFGGRILRGDILTASRFGVLSFHHADNRINRGVPAGFWEVFHRQKTTGFTLQRLTDDLDAGDVIMRGHFATRHYYLLNQAFLFEKSNYYLKLLVERIALTGQLPKLLPNFPYSNILYRNPRALELALYSTRFWYELIRKRLTTMFGRAARWNVGYVYRNWREAEYWRRIEIKNPAFRYLADPFVIAKNGRHYCFMEELDYRTERGSIVVYELTRNGGIRLGVALQEDFHLSFPYLFMHENQLYMCPECCESKSIRIYKCVEFPLRWELAAIAMDGVSAVDTMLFEKDGKWWMLTNIDPSGIKDYCSELFVFSADSPFAKDWRPHPLNPVIVDAARGRNAGLLKDGSSYFRCSQQQGFDLYGECVQINQIVELTDTSFVERHVATVTPSFGSAAFGTHHLHSDDDVTVFDFLNISSIASGVAVD